jgi:hypothetical protein
MRFLASEKKTSFPMPLNTLLEPYQFFSLAKIAGVNDTGDKHKIAPIAANFCKIKIRNAPMRYSGARGQLVPVNHV